MIKKILSWVVILFLSVLLVAGFFMKDNMNNYLSEMMKQRANPEMTIDSLYNYSQKGLNYEITFLEFGSKGCSACKRMEGVTPTAEAMLANKKTEFFKDYREKGVPPTQVPDAVVEPLVVKVMNAPDDMIMTVSEVFEYQWNQPVHSFNTFVCEECGEDCYGIRAD